MSGVEPGEPGRRVDPDASIPEQVGQEVTLRLGAFLTPLDRDAEGPSGYRTIETFGDDGVVVGLDRSQTKAFTFVRWEYGGRHTHTVEASQTAETSETADNGRVVVRPTGNRVVVDGLTVVEQRGEERIVRWFVDWLGVYAQMGVVIQGRPVRMGASQLSRPHRPRA